MRAKEDRLYDAILAVVELANLSYEEAKKAMNRVLNCLYDKMEF